MKKLQVGFDAISGTTPPYNVCNAICDEITLDNTSLPFLTTAAAVSSQELSIARIKTSFSAIIFSHLPHLIRHFYLFILLSVYQTDALSLHLTMISFLQIPVLCCGRLFQGMPPEKFCALRPYSFLLSSGMG